MKVLILTTGGTIDKIYFDDMSKFEVGESNIDEMLRNLNVNFEYKINSLMRKDSLYMEDSDRKKIYEFIVKSKYNKVLITHGTDTMIDTGIYLKSIKDKTIVLTGSMQPADFIKSDAVFNVGFALGVLQVLENGVYITMNGRICDPEKVEKDREKGIFKEKD